MSYYLHANSSCLDIYETTDFTMINSIQLEDIPFKYIWYQEDVVVLQGQKLILIDPLEGIVEKIPLTYVINDITEYNGRVWGCYDGGVIELKLSGTAKARPIKYEAEFCQIISADVIYLRSREKIYKMVKRSISEVLSSEGMIQGIGKQLATIKPNEVVIGSRIFDIPNVKRVVKFDEYGFITDKSVIYDREYVGFVDIIYNDQVLIIKPGKNGLEVETVDDKSLSTLLAKTLPDSVLDYCNTITKEDEIQKSVLSLSAANQTKLYEIIIPKISKNVLSSPVLSLWLKWLLLINKSGLLLLKSNKVKLLNSSLNKSVGLMGTLLSLRGRLNLIRAQGDLKAKELVHDHEFENGDDSVFIANGEDDS